MPHLLLTDEADLRCDHGCRVILDGVDRFVRINGRPVLLDADIVGKKISMCPKTPASTGCLATATATKSSVLVRVSGLRAGTTELEGLTTALPNPFRYGVRAPGQPFVSTTT